MKIIFTIILLSLAFVSCGNKSSEKDNKRIKDAQEIILPEPEIQIEELVIQTSRSFNIPNNRLVSISTNRFNSLNHEEKITAQIIDLDFKKYLEEHGNRQRRSLKEKMQQFLAEVNALKINITNTQVLMEEILTRQVSSNILYHYAKNNLFDIFETQRLQCQSAAHLYLITQRTSQENHDPKNVMIFTPGHMLPGKIVWDKNHYKLIGIETTLASNNEIDFGDTRTIDLPIRVVMASDYALILANKENLISPATQIQTALQRSAELFGFNLERSERNIHEYYQNQMGELFSFGTDTRLSENSSRQNESVLNSQNYFTSFLAYQRIQARIAAQTNNNLGGFYQELNITTHVLNIIKEDENKNLILTINHGSNLGILTYDFYTTAGDHMGSCNAPPFQRSWANNNIISILSSPNIFSLREFSPRLSNEFLHIITRDHNTYGGTLSCPVLVNQIYDSL